MQVVLSVKKVTKVYENNMRALNNVSFDVYKGEIFSLLGPNGAGKTTLIKIITGQLEPTSGEIRILGVSGEDLLKSDVRLKLSYVPQENIIWPHLTVEENLRLIGSLYKIDKNTLKNIIRDLLEKFELLEARRRLAVKLSGGMKRKLSIAMALINDPEILVLDEPTAGLDPRARASMLASLEKLKELGKTILLTTHIVEETERLADRVAIINRGEIVAIDTPANLKSKSCGREVLEILFREVDEATWRKLASIVDEKNIARAGDKLIIKEDNLPATIEKIRSDNLLYDKILALSIRKSSLEDAFLFLTGQFLGGG